MIYDMLRGLGSLGLAEDRGRWADRERSAMGVGLRFQSV